MDFPRLSDKHKYPGIFGADDILRLRGNLNKRDFRDANAGIICFQSSVMKYISKRFGGRKTNGFTGTVALLNKTKRRVLAARTNGIGAPTVAILIEELSAVGINRCISIGVGGALQDSIAAGDIICPTETVRDEGTSYHYLDAAECPRPSDKLFGSITEILKKHRIEFLSGPIWTTDAPYRETAEEIELYQREGVLAVDMETSAFLSVCSALKIEAASCIVAADSLAGGKWDVRSNDPEVSLSLRHVADAAVEALML